ncbi:uncharacterized protein N7446_007918 [Penicillium canescens]|uniref:Uncharacterized protein n=1 Tax=Penicillium canescens TaxID=5083 RepID=A0AAD6INT8_PENCN|nr:uncharacterized protein N7446_007865 [Penicillium canescens]XP_058370309.1 uncharacterized protein N7446_007918 [Penicillium canescens]KAJ6033789.1 hypothetical protein N7444_011560 [Penicillium canescens]KAJ6033844.1 hypothetical protein N7444_011615 [Penicillium canescens]KAJ6056968.1 hypothetical protein N7460_000242 [Penicillium canescens]KAJ6057018.1 hypothetical protein N7460_000292 [Penicillium canescens]KAJ6058282.1 hypothetical protein N7446_007865 [Penicillium canescens]
MRRIGLEYSSQDRENPQMALKSNETRAAMRQQCREALSAHIHNRLGLDIAPSQVRLQPPVEDGYAWSVTESKKSLLQSSLSNGSVGLFRAISEELGRSLEAVTPQTLQDSDLERDDDPGEEEDLRVHEEEDGSFTAKIRQLEGTNRELGVELDRTRVRLDDARSKRDRYQTKTRRLQSELEASSLRTSRLETELTRVRAGITEAMKALQSHGNQNSTSPAEERNGTGYQERSREVAP